MSHDRLKHLETESAYKAITTMSLPIILGMLIQVFYNLTDTFFIGKLNDPNQLAASSIAFPFFMLLMALGSIAGTGGSSYISRTLGAGQKERANKILTTSVLFTIGLGCVVATLAVVFCKPFISILGTTTNTFAPTYDYILILAIGSPIVMLNFTLGQLLRAEGAIKPAMIGMLVGTVTNIILDPILIFTFGMEIKGAALATILGNFLGLVYSLICYAKGQTMLKISFKGFTLDRFILWEILKIGLPSSLNQGLMSIAGVFGNNIAALYGDAIIAGIGVASRIVSSSVLIVIGLSAGCQPLIGYSYGSKNFHRVKEIIIKSTAIGTLIGITFTIIFALFSDSLINMFIDDVEVIGAGSIILKALILSLPLLGIQMISTTALQAMGKALPAMVLSICRQGLLYIPLLFILNHLGGFNGFIYAQPVTDFVTAIIGGIMLTSIVKKEILDEQIVPQPTR